MKPGGLSVGLNRDFGSVERWSGEFSAMAARLQPGSGRVMLCWSRPKQRLFNHFAAEPSSVPEGATPIVDLDGVAGLDGIDWDAAGLRYAAAVEASTADLGVEADKVAASSVLKRIDVRRKGAFDSGIDMIAGASWRDPEKVDEWAKEFSGTEIVVYCVYGHEVGQSTAARLRDAGVSARFLPGGIDEWRASGRPMQAKPAGK